MSHIGSKLVSIKLYNEYTKFQNNETMRNERSFEITHSYHNSIKHIVRDKCHYVSLIDIILIFYQHPPSIDLYGKDLSEKNPNINSSSRDVYMYIYLVHLNETFTNQEKHHSYGT